MAYRRRAGVSRATTTFKEDLVSPSSPSPFFEEEESDDGVGNDHNYKNKKSNPKKDDSGSLSLAALATRASAAHRDSSGYGSAYASATATATATADPPSSSSSSSHRQSDHFPSHSFSRGPDTTSTKDSDDPKYGFWGVLARKAKSILDEEDNQFHSSAKIKSQGNQQDDQTASSRVDNAKLRKRIDAITSSLNNLGDTLGNAFEEGRTIMEHKTADIIQETRNRTADFIQETRKIQLRRRGGGSDNPDQATVVQNTSWQRPIAPSVQTNALTNQETQLKASRDVAMATAAKAKVLLRELKTVKADLAFAKERCAQLEEENKRLRVSREKGDNPADDDLIRLQLETLLAEKARLAHENSIYARENRFLREIVEYHQLTMQDVVYLDEGAEEVTEVYPFYIDDAKVLSGSPTSPTSPSFLPEVSQLSLSEIKEHTNEVPKEILNMTSSYLAPSSPPMVNPTSCPPERTESLEVPTSSKLMTDGDLKASCYGETPIAGGEAPQRPSVPSP